MGESVWEQIGDGEEIYSGSRERAATPKQSSLGELLPLLISRNKNVKVRKFESVIFGLLNPLTPIVANMRQTVSVMQSAEIALSWRKKHTQNFFYVQL